MNWKLRTILPAAAIFMAVSLGATPDAHAQNF